MKSQHIVAVIPARGGSKGLYKKNIKIINQHPLIAYAIKAARDANMINRTIVATDDQEIADIARTYHAEVPFLLPDELTHDHTRLEETFTYMTNKLQESGQTIDYICFVDPTRPVRPLGYLDTAIRTMLEGDYDSVISGVKEYKSVWKETDGILARLDSGFTVRQLKKDKIYICYSGLITCTRAKFMQAGKRLGDNILIHEFDDFNMTVDVHKKDELRLAEMILAEWPDRYVNFA